MFIFFKMKFPLNNDLTSRFPGRAVKSFVARGRVGWGNLGFAVLKSAFIKTKITEVFQRQNGWFPES